MNLEKQCPKVELPKNVKSALVLKQSKQKQNYDKTAVSLTPLKIGEAIRYRQAEKWQPCVVIDQDQNNPRSYKICTPDGAKYIRNRRHLLKTNEEMHPQEPDLTENDIMPSPINETTPPISPHLDQSKTEPSKIEIPAKINNQNVTKTDIYTTRFGREIKPNPKYQ